MMYVDNQPDYYTTMGPPFCGVGYEVLATSEVEHTDEGDLCDPTFQRTFVRVKEITGSLSIHEVGKLLSRAFTPPRCYHEFDCCGCRYGHAVATPLTADTFEIETYTGRNY